MIRLAVANKRVDARANRRIDRMNDRRRQEEKNVEEKTALFLHKLAYWNNAGQIIVAENKNRGD